MPATAPMTRISIPDQTGLPCVQRVLTTPITKSTPAVAITEA
jgi:hypothetical protein